MISSGYFTRHSRLYRLWNLCLVIPIIVFCLPLLASITLLLLLTQPRPIIHKGLRLGKDREPFFIYKFRTLRPEAEALTAKQTLPTRSNMETLMGGYLRRTRLDELPQLLNVLRGDMNLLGPRPARPALAIELAAQLPDYETRFKVKPGLLGYAQVYMTHGTSKRLRSKYNAYLVRRRAFIWKEPAIVAMMTCGIALKLGSGFLTRLRLAVVHKTFVERRQVGRRSPGNAEVYLIEHGTAVNCGELLNINDEAFLIRSAKEFTEGEHVFLLKRGLPSRRQSRQARCVGHVRRNPAPTCTTSGVQNAAAQTSSPYRYLIFYKPISDLDWYLVDRYFLDNAILI